MRIVSLVPSATEMLFALGLGDEVTAVTHECDFPPEALDLPRITRDVIGPGLAPGEMAEGANHHPDILIHGWNKVRLTLSTHPQGKVTQADHDLAAGIDGLGVG